MRATRREFLQWTGLVGLSLGAGCSGALRAGGAKRPNIVIIMADDMGFSDVGCFGGEIATPNLDRLAAGGLRFTQFYNCARCCPTRASLLTGQYPHQVGLTVNGRSLTRNGLTIAEALRRAGYRTGMAGKWHLSLTPVLPDAERHQAWLDHRYDPQQPFAPLETYPVNRGFDKHYGVIWGVINHFDPFSLVEGTEPVRSVPEDYYFTDAITDKAVDYIQDWAGRSEPFFLYVAHCAPHWPLHARPEDIAKYKDTYKAGWDQLRADRYRRQVATGLFDAEHTPLPPVQTRGRSWETLSDEQKAFEARKMAVHAAMVDRVDQSTGRILEALGRAGQLDNTVIFFLSDNGASPEIMHGPGYDRTGHTRDGTPVMYDTSPIELLGSERTYMGIGTPWASASNTPFRYWKQESFDGGCHTPLIVHWPTGLKTPPGAVCSQVGHVMDLMPTCLELAGATYPDSYEGHALTPLMGKSLGPVLRGRTRDGYEALFFEHVGGRAVRMGDWKLVAFSRTQDRWELYNLADDLTETRDLAAQHPDRVRAMAAAWGQWAQSVDLPVAK
ncbi:MAG TPA: arylsulfatase [Phycisphaerales bacterium]|nr:arylsulfatase [Phycisphaerales bacterium]